RNPASPPSWKRCHHFRTVRRDTPNSRASSDSLLLTAPRRCTSSTRRRKVNRAFLWVFTGPLAVAGEGSRQLQLVTATTCEQPPCQSQLAAYRGHHGVRSSSHRARRAARNLPLGSSRTGDDSRALIRPL